MTSYVLTYIAGVLTVCVALPILAYYGGRAERKGEEHE